MYRPGKIADYFLSKYGKENKITPMKINKLVYIACGWYLAITEKSLIDENPEAWKYGPIIASLYHRYKSFRNSPITNIPSECKLGNKEDERFLDRIWEVYGKYSGIQLGAKTNCDDSPWAVVWNELINNKGNEILSLQIPKSYIKDHYRRLYLENRFRDEQDISKEQTWSKVS